MATMGVELAVLLSVCFSSIDVARAPLGHFSDCGFQIADCGLHFSFLHLHFEIPNPKHQITNKSQIPILNDPNIFEILFFYDDVKV
jgi:hypothetical protein